MNLDGREIYRSWDDALSDPGLDLAAGFFVAPDPPTRWQRIRNRLRWAWNRWRGTAWPDGWQQLGATIDDVPPTPCTAPFTGPMQPVHPCREMPTRHCPAVYDAVCGDRPCARYESTDPEPWRPELSTRDTDGG